MTKASLSMQISVPPHPPSFFPLLFLLRSLKILNNSSAVFKTMNQRMI